MKRIPFGFPDHFLWGGALSANQAEGAYHVQGKGLSVPDINLYRPDIPFSDRNPAKVTTTSLQWVLQNNKLFFPKRCGIGFYYQYKTDLKLLANLGLKSFKISIAWSRIFPKGFEKKPNEAGLLFYDQLINEIKANGMIPMVTLYHDEMPLYLTTHFKGWYSRKLVDYFIHFCRVVLDRYHHQVKYWIIINHINSVKENTFNHLGLIADKAAKLTLSAYQAAHHEMIASAYVTQYAHQNYPGLQIGMSFHSDLAYPTSYDPENILATLRYNQMEYFFADVLLRGYYPDYAYRFFSENDIQIIMHPEDESILTNTADFMAFSYISTRLCSKSSFSNGRKTYLNPDLTTNTWGQSNDPIGLRTCLNLIYDRYQCPIYATDFGMGFYDDVIGGKIQDDYRIAYHQTQLEQLQEAIMDGVVLKGYYPWAPIDIVSANTAEMEKRYGFIYVDIDNYGRGSGERILKKSYEWYRKTIASNGRNLKKKNN